MGHRADSVEARAGWSRRAMLRGAGAAGLAIAGRRLSANAQEATPAAGGLAAPTGPVKLVVLYLPPADLAAFDDYYLNKHLPKARAIPGYLRLEVARVVATPDGSPAPYHRISELLFPDHAAMQVALASPEGQTALADQANFAQAGAVALITAVDVSEGPAGAATPTA